MTKIWLVKVEVNWSNHDFLLQRRRTNSGADSGLGFLVMGSFPDRWVQLVRLGLTSDGAFAVRGKEKEEKRKKGRGRKSTSE